MSNTKFNVTGHGARFTRVSCAQHTTTDYDNFLSDGYDVASAGVRTDEPCETCDDYAQQTAAEIRANTQ